MGYCNIYEWFNRVIIARHKDFSKISKNDKVKFLR
jgi:hypothetical protein